jgi:hypothetical protein
MILNRVVTTQVNEYGADMKPAPISDEPVMIDLPDLFS